MQTSCKDARFRRVKYQPFSKVDAAPGEYTSAKKRFRREGKAAMREVVKQH